MKKSGIYVLIFLIILVAAAVISVSRLNLGGGNKPEETARPAVEDTAAPAASEAPTAPASPEPSPETPTLEETPIPEETQTPTPTPAPSKAPASSSGSFSSDTGTNMNIVVSWLAYNSADGAAELEIDIDLRSYSLFTDALPGSVTLTVDGVPYTLGSPKISYDGDAQTTIPLCSKTVSVTQGDSTVDISVNWNFRGSYGGTDLENIIAEGTATIG